MHPAIPRLATALALLCPAAAAHVQLLSPNGFESFRGQSMVLIEWFDSVSHGNEVSYTLEYSADGGLVWTDIATGLPYTNGADSYLWTVPDVATTTGLIRVTMVVNPFLSYQDTNDFYFEVTPSYVGYGAGTPLNGVEPVVAGVGLPTVGSTVRIELLQAQPGSPAMFLAGSARDHRSFRGVTILTRADLGRQVELVDPAGAAAVEVPLAACMAGSTYFAQAVVFSAPTYSASAGLGFTVLP